MLPGIIALLAVMGGIVLILIIAVIGIYNSMISLRNTVDNSWHQIDVQLRKRYDLIPNLVETVKGYAKHERETLQNVINARKLGIDAGDVRSQAKAENMITGALKSLFAVSENYPNLKADQQFSKLMDQLNGIESNIAFARQFYNDMVLRFNNRIQTFPGNMFARMFHFSSRDYFEIEEASARGPVKVKF